MLCYRVYIDWIRNSDLCKEATLSEEKYQCLRQNSYEEPELGVNIWGGGVV